MGAGAGVGAIGSKCSYLPYKMVEKVGQDAGWRLEGRKTAVASGRLLSGCPLLWLEIQQWVTRRKIYLLGYQSFCNMVGRGEWGHRVGEEALRILLAPSLAQCAHSGQDIIAPSTLATILTRVV